MPAPQALAIFGPTASGKTALALQLAQHKRIEVISIDSALVYREMDIGTAKPTSVEQATVAHHLIDIRNPDESYSAADFAQDTRRLMQEIAARGSVPVLVGGTMMYHKALVAGLDDLPAANADIRLRIEERAARLGWPALHAELAQVDAVTAARLPPRDSQRIQRALEVYELTGRPLSSFHQRGDEPLVQLAVVSLEPEDRSQLHARIAQRFADMLKAGFVAEVEGLRRRWTLHAGLPSMRCVGYRQVWEMLEGQLPESELLDRGIFATRQLAKRQLTWLRSLPDRQVFDPFAPSGLRDALTASITACDAIETAAA